MPTPLSMDLRQRIVDAYQNGEGSSRDLAERFGVAPSTVSEWARQLHDRGTLQPLPNRGRQTLWQPPQLKALRKALDDKPDATLDQLAEALEPVVGRRLVASTIWRGLQRLNVTRKKKISTRPNAIDLTSRHSE